MSNNLSDAPSLLPAAGFVESCRRYPTAIALHINGVSYTYGQLLAKTETVFSQLAAAPVADYVGIYAHESVWTYASILAISLSGACYVPLNPKLPGTRLTALLEECRPGVILSEHRLPFKHTGREILLDTDSENRRTCTQIAASENAYLLFTSGSTGTPKGVPVSKHNLAAFFDHCRLQYDFTASDRFLQPYELSFDVSVFSIFAAWNAGAAVYCVPEDGLRYLNIVKTLQEHQITVCSMVPGVLLYLEKYLPELSFPHLRYSFFSGDKLYHRLASKWQAVASRAQLYNCYGPTETTVVCTSYPWQESRSEKESVNGIVPLGKPFAGMTAVLINEGVMALPGEIGELCFTGKQVIASYLNNANSEAFFYRDGKRFYKTGDLASENATGNLVFHGRKDSQVKINGYRVELLEVEFMLSRVSGKNTVVFSVEHQQVSRLIAYLESADLEEAVVKTQLATLLPAYMIPERIFFVPTFPRNLNGKIDKQQLNGHVYEK